MTHSTRVTLTRAARLALMLHLRDLGWLRGKSLAQVARVFRVERSTILRDKRLLARLVRMRAVIEKRVKRAMEGGE